MSLAQDCSNLGLALQNEIPSICDDQVLTMQHDNLDRPFLYVANTSAGLSIYDITDIQSPLLVNTIPISELGSLNVMNLSQEGNYLYLALGNHFTNPQQGGMAIIDVTAPYFAYVTDYYIVPDSESGSGIVKVEDDYAYLCAMKSGLIIMDVTDKSDILFVSQFVPDINFPAPNPNPDFYNSRGLELRNCIAYLCHDAGGLRIINCEDKENPYQTGQYANPATFDPFNLPRAYNNIVLDDSLAYVSVDYCGIEVINISDTSEMILSGWWNPYNCPQNNWFTSPSHANELALDKECDRLFVSTGKSDMMVLDVSNPTDPDSCNYFGGVSNDIGTWGLSRYQNQIYLSYICTIIPFSSTWTGVKILSYNPCTSNISTNENLEKLIVYPNPASSEISIQGLSTKNNIEMEIENSIGQIVKAIQVSSNEDVHIDVSSLSPGLYFLRIPDNEMLTVSRFIVE